MLERGLGVAQRVRADDEVLVGVQRPAGSDQVVDLMMVQPEAMHEQDGVVLGGVELAVGDVGHLEVLDDPAALQLELTEVGKLMGRLIGPVGRGERAIRQRQD